MSGKKKGPGGGRPGGRPEDPWQDPDLLRMLKNAEQKLVPMVRESAVSVVPMMGVDGRMDLKFALELGVMILADKPIIAMIEPGQRISAHLVRVADEIVEIDPADEAGTKWRMAAAIERLGMDPIRDPGWASKLDHNPPPIEVPEEIAESITCPRCGMTSHNPNDVKEGYCGNCHDWTRE